MADTDLAEGIFIEYCGRERTPDGKTQYASFDERINLDTFSGTTHFEAVGEHLAWFAGELAAFYTDFSGQPELRCGVGEDVYFRLKFTRYNSQGHVLVEGDIRQRYRNALFHAVSVYYVIARNLYYAIARILRRAGALK